MTQKKSTGLSRRNLLVAGGGALAAATLVTSFPLLAMKTHSVEKKMKKAVNITQVRNATLLIEYAGTTFLVDPLFADQGALPGIKDSACSQFRNPLVPLPFSKDRLLAADAVIVTHTHEDHWDDAAKNAIPRDKPLFAQNEADAETIRGEGFSNVQVLTANTRFNNIALTITGGQHGNDRTVSDIPLGEVCGVVFSHPEYPTVYIAGDTIWNEHVQTAITRHNPDVIVMNVGNAVFMGYEPIIMGMEDALAVHKAAPGAMLIASHMEAINHCILSRQTLRNYSVRHGFDKNLLIPADGETVRL